MNLTEQSNHNNGSNSDSEINQLFPNEKDEDQAILAMLS